MVPGQVQENPQEKDTTEARAERFAANGFDVSAKVVVLGALNPKASWERKCKYEKTPGFKVSSFKMFLKYLETQVFKSRKLNEIMGTLTVEP